MIAFTKPGLGRVLFFLLCLTALLAGLSGCSSSSKTLWDGANAALFPKDPLETAKLDARFRYLRVDTGRNTALLVLGYVDPISGDTAHAEEVWYSGTKEVVRLIGGRLSSTAGLAANWQDVHFSAIPTWRSVLRASSGGSYQRTRDVMPGYVTGIHELVTIRAMAPPATLPSKTILPQGVQWFEEVATRMDGRASPLPPARFAVDLAGPVERVVYSQQCLSERLCLTFQPIDTARQL